MKRRYSSFPKTVGQCVEPLTKNIFKSRGLAGTRLLSEWKDIVGDKLASRCLPEKLSFPKGKTEGGTLTVSVENGFAVEMQHSQAMILERLATHFGYKAVTRIAIGAPLASAKKLSKAGPKAVLSPSSARTADQVSDPELKTVLQAFAHTLSRGEKDAR